MKHEKESIISKRFMITVAAIYSLLILGFSVSFNILIKKNGETLNETVLENNNALLLNKVDMIMTTVKSEHVVTVSLLKKKISRYLDRDRDLLYAIIYGKTEDENYFQIEEKVPSSHDIAFEPKRRDIVRAEKGYNYIKTALLQGIVEPRMYTDNEYCWQNVYYPYSSSRKHYVVQFMVSVSGIKDSLNQYEGSVSRMKIIIFIISIILSISIIITTYIFMSNYSLLIKNLSSYMKKAAEGQLDINLNPTEDTELNQLALSFNSLIDELKEKTDQSKENRDMKDIFNRGVNSLKENRLDEAIAIFKTLIIMKPESFGSYFNLGVAYAKRKEYDLSLEMFGMALEANPSFEITSKYIEKVMKYKNRDAGS